MSLEITILADRQVSTEGLRRDVGISLLVTGARRSLLFDLGRDGLVLQHNAARLNVDLAAVTTLVISHGHHDHTGGLEAMQPHAERLQIYAHPDAFLQRWSQQPGKPLRNVSCPYNVQNLLARGASWHAVKAPEKLEEGMLLSGPIGGTRGGETHYVVRRNDDLVADWFEDELCLLARGRRGWVIVTGCCHRGLGNMLKAARFLVRGEPIRAIVGGLHLHDAGKERWRETVTLLGRFGNPGVYPCHCTGEEAIAFLAKRLPGQIHPVGAGSRIDL